MSQKKIIGNFGEEMACKYLVKKGYTVLKRNLQRSNKEIDILAKKEEINVFVEVRTRTSGSMGGAEEAINRRKIKNFQFAVKSYVQINNLDFNKVRLDFIAVDIYKQKNTIKIKHFKDIA